MNVVRPHGLIERLDGSRRRPGQLARYGREKDGAPKDAESWRIAHANDRRERPRHEAEPLRGRLVDLDA